MYCYSSLPADEIMTIIERNPSDPELRLALMEHYMNAGEEEGAMTQARLAAELFPDHPESQIWNAIWYMMVEDMLQGQRMLEAISHRYPCIELAHRVQSEFVPAVFNLLGEAGESYPPENPIEEDESLDPESKRLLEESSARINLALLETQDAETAIAACEDYLRDWGQNVGGMLICTRIYQQHGLNQRAEQMLREILSANPDSTVAKVDLGYLIDDDQNAIKLFQSALQVCNFDQRARCGLGERLIKTGMYVEALEHLSRVPADSLFYCSALGLMSDSHSSMENSKVAKQCIEKALILQPGNEYFQDKLDQFESA